MEEKQTMSRTRSKRQKRRKRKKRFLSSLGIGTLLVFLGIACIVGYGYWKMDQIFNKVSETVGGNPANAASAVSPSLTGPQNEKETEKPFAIALIGTDTRAGGGGLNTDVLMVAVVDPKDKAVQLLSIPRDTKVEVPGYSGYRKVNSAYALGESTRSKQERKGEEITENGYSLVKKTLAEFLDIPIHYHVQIDFEGFVQVVDAVNGVKVNVKRSMQYDDDIDGTHIHIKAGEQVLDGANALGYVRHRLDNRGESYYSSDFERNERQQEVIKGILDKLISFQGVTKLDDVMDAITDNVSTNLSPNQLKKLTKSFITLKPSEIATIENHAYWDSRQSFTVFPEENLKEIRQHLREFLKLEKK